MYIHNIYNSKLSTNCNINNKPVQVVWGRDCTMVTHSLLTSEIGVQIPASVGKLVVACNWSAVSGTKPCQLCVLVVSTRLTSQ